MTTDVEAAQAFYSAVVGWTAADAGMNDSPYRIFSMGSAAIAGLMPMPDEQRAMRAPPMWMGHIGVDDVDAMAERVVAAGGKILRAPEDIPEVGRFAVAQDPHGAVFLLFHPNGSMPPEESTNMPGRIGWNELHGGEVNSDFAFYSGLFGWTKDVAINMGPMRVYQVFQTSGSGGGMMTKMPEMPHPIWLYYINVDAADAAAARIGEAGGKVMTGPHEVPGGSWIVQGIDPQGAMFAVVALKR